MRQLYFAALSLLLVITTATAQLPRSEGEVVEHTHYTLAYNEEHEQAEWVYYHLTPELLAGSAKRSDDFRPDPKISTASASLADYVGSGYDRGHLCPAASMSRSAEASSESFYMSNMSPQAPSFNRGMWKRLEVAVRTTASADSIVYVVTGPLFDEPIGTIGANRVTIPSAYYKVLYSPKRGEMIGFVMPNQKLAGSIADFVTTVDSIEQISGIDFFAGADEEIDAAEAESNFGRWSFDAPAPLPKSSATTTQTNATSQRCKGVTSSGKPCRNNTKNANGYCHLHQSQAE